MIRKFEARLILEYLYCSDCDVEMQPLSPGFYQCPHCNRVTRNTGEYPRQVIERGEPLMEPVQLGMGES